MAERLRDRDSVHFIIELLKSRSGKVLKPISDATRELIAKKYKNSAGLSIGMSPALVIGHPTTLVVSLLLIPVTIFLAVILPGNKKPASSVTKYKPTINATSPIINDFTTLPFVIGRIIGNR